MCTKLLTVCVYYLYILVAVWLSDKALLSVKPVVVHWARLVLGWVTVFR